MLNYDNDKFFGKELKVYDTKRKLGKIIAYTGTHGTGKTTAVYEKAKQLKIENPGKSVTVITEVASRCPFPINKETTPEAQLWIFTRQITEELEAIQRYDIVVSDRTIVDAIAYTQVAGFRELFEGMVYIASEHVSKYSDIIFKSCKKNNFLHDDGIRDSKDMQFREDIEAALLEIYNILGDSNWLAYE